MREVRGLADAMRNTIKQIRAEATSAAQEFASEHTATKAAVSKVKSLTSELRSARQDVESMLGESGSNFPTQDDTESQTQESLLDGGVADVNGVTVNRG